MKGLRAGEDYKKTQGGTEEEEDYREGRKIGGKEKEGMGEEKKEENVSEVEKKRE